MSSSVTDESGATLLEVLIAVVILGITVAAVLTGLLTSVSVSDIHRKQATAGAYARDYAETVSRYVAAGNYASCAGQPDYTPAFTALPAPSDFQASIASVRYWNPDWTAGSTSSPWGTSCTPSTDAGLQQVTVMVASTDGRASERSVVVVRRP